MKYLADRREIRISPMQSGMKVAPELAAHIGKRINSNRIDARSLHPPKSVLDQILRNERILLIHVRHCVDKPSMNEIGGCCRGRVRIDEVVKVTAGVKMLRNRAMKPIGCRGIGNPRMLKADVIG